MQNISILATIPSPLRNPRAKDINGFWLVIKVSIGVTPSFISMLQLLGNLDEACTGVLVLLSVVYAIFVVLPILVSIFITQFLALPLYISLNKFFFLNLS